MPILLLPLTGCDAKLGATSEETGSVDADAAPGGETGSLGVAPGVRRLTRAEYANTVRHLFGVEVDPRSVPAEQLVKGHSQIAGAQRVGYADADQFYTLGLTVAAEAAPAILASTGCDDSTCLAPHLEDLVILAFRGSVTASVLERYLALVEAPDAGADLEDRLVTLIAAVLSSPRFVSRYELTEKSPSAGTHQLSGVSIATRLAYLVWQSSPDEQLLESALSGKLETAEGRLSELDRLLADPRAKSGALAFVLDWMGALSNRIPEKDATLLSEVGADFTAAAEESFRLTVDDALFGAGEGSLAGLLTTERFFGNDSFATAVGATSSSTTEPLNITAGERRGILTHPYVLAAHTKESGASPFPLGEFIFENILCEEIPPPPPGIPTVAGEDTSGLTLRERLEELTDELPCSNCHERIGPPGFAFLPYDAVGRYQNTDGLGTPWDTSGTLLVTTNDGDEHAVEFASTVELASTLGSSEASAACLIKRAFRFAYGRFEEGGDDRTAVSALIAEADPSVELRALLASIVSQDAFAEVSLK